MSRQIVLTTAEGVELEYTLAGVGSRFLAALLDSLFQGLLMLLLVLLAMAFFSVGRWYSEASSLWVMAVAIIAAFLVMDGYYVIYETVWTGQTPGKRMTGLRVLRDDGFPLDFRGAAIRNAMRIVDFLPSFYGVGVLCIFLNSTNRRLGDMVAGTIVVRERDEDAKGIHARGFSWQTLEPATLPHGLPLPLNMLTPQHVELAETFLRRRDQLAPDLRATLGHDVANRLRAQMQMPAQASFSDEQLLETVVRERARQAGL